MDLSRWTRTPAFTALAVVALGVTVASAPPAATPHERSPAVSSAHDIEVAWVRAHLDSVLRELPRHDVNSLTAGQRERRAALVATLRSYRDRGQFPRNYDFPGQAVPYFTDRKTGTLCAVGYLLASTGRHDIVERVTRANNNVRVRELAGDTALVAWLDANGLTLAEAARIQVVYAQAAGPAQTRRDVFLALTPFALAGSVATGTWNALGNANGHRVAPAVTGLLSGVASIALGATLSGAPGIPKSSGLISAGVGGLSVALAIRALVQRHDIAAAIRAEQKTVIVGASIVPIIAMGRNASTGLAISMRF